ncbi:MAG: RHS repeat-associated core domain-containing protein, partial [Parachlamydiaceae bacterium]
SGLSYFGRRYYDPTLGRWLTPDPIGYEDGSNLYAYVHNNPCFYSDPEGKFAFAIPVLAIAFGSGEAVATFITLETLGYVALTAVCAYGVCKINELYDAKLEAIHMAAESQSEGGLTGKAEETKGKDRAENSKQKPKGKRHTPDQQALNELANEVEEKGVRNEDAETLLNWGTEYNFPNTRDDRGKTHWKAKDGQSHIHIGSKHIPVND